MQHATETVGVASCAATCNSADALSILPMLSLDTQILIAQSRKLSQVLRWTTHATLGAIRI